MINNSIKLLAAVALACLLCSCAGLTPTPLQTYSAEMAELLSGRALLGRTVSEAELPAHDLLALSPEMAEFARQTIRRSYSSFDKVKALHIALLSARAEGGHGMVYNAYATEPPSISFQQRRANCLSFTLLYVALARSVGLSAKVNEVEIPPTWDLRANNDMVFLRHVNIKVPLLDEGNNLLLRDSVVIDLEMSRYNANYRQHEISDSQAAAQFYSNRAMEYLNANNVTDAFLNLRKSIALNNQQSYVWSNLGTLYGRQQLLREAEQAYLHALAVNPKDLTVMNNLAHHYRQTGNSTQAQKFARLAQRYREANPYYKYHLAQAAMARAEYAQALTWVLQAIASEKNEVRFYQLAASLYEHLARPTKVLDMHKKIAQLQGE
jgi:predicted Zn-dependent protease